MYKTAFTKNHTSFDDYFKKKSGKKKSVTLGGIDDGIEEMTKTAVLNTPEATSTSAPPKTGSAVKSAIQGVLSKKYGELDTKHLFDSISDNEVEDNFETAESTIKTNIDRGLLSEASLAKLPNLRDGLALSYAAANKGNSKAATRAREAAYTERVDSLVDKVKNGLSYELPKMENAVLKTNEKPKVTKLLGNPNEKPEIEDFLMKTSLSDENKEQNSDNPLLDTDVSWTNKALGDSKKADGAKTPIYSGDIWDNEQQEDLTGNDISHKDLYGFFTPSDNKYIAELQKGIVPFIKDLRINAKDLLVPENVHIQRFRSLGNLSSFTNKDMNKVANQLIDHFLSGTGDDFSSDEFTKAFGEHKETQRYMDDFTKTFKEELSNYNGSVTEIMNSGKFNEALRKNRVLLSQYDYSDFKDLLGGYTFSVHSWTESDVSLKNFKINDDGTYKGVLEFTFKDNFGLDKNDLPPQYAAIPGFKSWFILQHSKKYNGKYKPFKTVAVLEKEFSGTLERNEK